MKNSDARPGHKQCHRRRRCSCDCGARARSYAFLIDWCIRAVLCTAWYAVAALIYNGRLGLSPPLNQDARWFVFVVAPPAAIYFLYHVALEIAMHAEAPASASPRSA